MVFNATFNIISVISWWSVLLLEEMGIPGENHPPATSHWQTLSHNVTVNREILVIVLFWPILAPKYEVPKLNTPKYVTLQKWTAKIEHCLDIFLYLYFLYGLEIWNVCFPRVLFKIIHLWLWKKFQKSFFLWNH